jgi:NADPH:quinone reductase-like Zn-dependent oxidoreductase
MKAALVKQHGGIENLVIAEVPRPHAGHGEVLIKIAAASLNHIDLWVRRGIPGMNFHLPHAIGSDGCGIVSEIGPGVRSVQLGQRVVLYPAVTCGTCEFCQRNEECLCTSFSVIGEQRAGTFGEYVAVPESCVFPKPENLSFEEAAAMPLVFLTAWRMLVTRAQINRDDTILIIGIGGGVAGAALCIAKQFGAKVIVTSGSDDKLERAKSFGADETINHSARRISAEARRLTAKRGVDVVIDSVGGQAFSEGIFSLAKGGRLVTCGSTTGINPPLEIPRVFWNHLTIMGSTLGTRREFLDVLRCVREKNLRPIVDSVHPFDDIQAAQERMESHAQFGKIVLRP